MKNKKLVGALLALLCLSMLFTGCGKNTHELTYYPKTGNYYDSKTDVGYRRAELYYEAAGVLRDHPYAHIPSKSMDDTILYQIEGAEPEQMLANSYLEIFYATDMTLPKLWEMGANKIYVGSRVAGAVLDFVVATVVESDDLDAVISTYQSGTFFHEDVRYSEGTVAASYNIRFASPQYPAFFYRLFYYEYAEDVLIYEVIDSKESFTPTYSGISYAFDESYVDRGELYAVYNFGKNLIYDHVTGNYYAVGDTIAKHIPAED